MTAITPRTSPCRRTALHVALLLAMAAFLWILTGNAGEYSRVFLPNILPANTIVCMAPPDASALEQGFSGSLFQRLSELPEMRPFLQSFEESRRRLAGDIATAANVSPQFAAEMVNGKLGFALINIEIGRDGKPAAEFIVTLSLPGQPDRATVHSAVMALLNRPEVVRAILESQGLDPNLPLKTLAQEETLSGYPPVLRIGPDIRIATMGNTVFLYKGQGSEGVKKLFDIAATPSSSLSRSAAFQAVYQGCGANPGSSFAYVNVPRVTAILDAMNLGAVTKIIDAIGLASVQAMGVAGTYQNDGVRHSMYLYSPGGRVGGLLSSLVPMPGDSRVGMEGFAHTIPAAAESFAAFRVDVPTFLRELPYFLESIGAVTRPGGMTSLLSNERILGVPLPDLIRTLGGDIVIRPHDDTQVVMFHNVDIPAFDAVIARMEQSAGGRFNSINIGGYIIRYYNRRSSLAAPLAPAFCLVPRSAGSNRGILYTASHPQALVSMIQESLAAREPLSGTQDFLRTATPMGGNYSLYYYNGNRDSYRRIYNFLLPAASLWASASRYPVDTGLLPPASTVAPHFFGCAIGVRGYADGLLIQIFSPIGANVLPLLLADKLVISNPLVLGYAYSFLDSCLTALPTW